MQDRYAGDIGDFGKLGLLRALNAAGLSIGVNWYRTTPLASELTRDDGRYRIPKNLFHCDVELAKALFEISQSDNPERSVKALEEAKLIDGAVYFSELVRIADRLEWHREAMTTLRCCDLVFLDPDNGLLVKSVSPNSARSVKYALYEEVGKYVAAGKSAVIYNHRCRKKWDVYAQFITEQLRLKSNLLNNPIRAITFPRFSVRDYFIISATPEHDQRIQSALGFIENSVWNRSGLCTKSVILKNAIT